MPRKHTSSTKIEQHDTENLNSRQVLQLLTDIQTKVLSSAALNGGFDNLMFKIENIETAQSGMSDKVNMIHDALYKPDDGFFARVKQVEEEAHETHSQTETIRALDVSVTDLKRWKNLVDRVAKWALIAVGGGIATLIGKLLYDFISGHIKIV